MSRISIPESADDNFTFSTTEAAEVQHFIDDITARVGEAKTLQEIAVIYAKAGEYAIGKLAEHRSKKRRRVVQAKIARENARDAAREAAHNGK